MGDSWTLTGSCILIHQHSFQGHCFLKGTQRCVTGGLRRSEGMDERDVPRLKI